jgi:hypothetical protein
VGTGLRAVRRRPRRHRDAGRLHLGAGAARPRRLRLHDAGPDRRARHGRGPGHLHGDRHRRASGLAGARVSRSIVARHVGNEYGGACYCDRCAAAFRSWLRARYGTMEALNAAWYTAFWSHAFSDWDEIEPPTALSEHWRGPDQTAFPGITLDYRRFMSDAMLANFLDEKAATRESSLDVPVTTNFMGMYGPIDYHRWAPHLDFVSWDNYPPDRGRDRPRRPTGHPRVPRGGASGGRARTAGRGAALGARASGAMAGLVDRPGYRPPAIARFGARPGHQSARWPANGRIERRDAPSGRPDGLSRTDRGTFAR